MSEPQQPSTALPAGGEIGAGQQVGGSIALTSQNSASSAQSVGSVAANSLTSADAPKTEATQEKKSRFRVKNIVSTDAVSENVSLHVPPSEPKSVDSKPHVSSESKQASIADTSGNYQNAAQDNSVQVNGGITQTALSANLQSAPPILQSSSQDRSQATAAATAPKVHHSTLVSVDDSAPGEKKVPKKSRFIVKTVPKEVQ